MIWTVGIYGKTYLVEEPSYYRARKAAAAKYAEETGTDMPVEILMKATSPRRKEDKRVRSDIRDRIGSLVGVEKEEV